VALAGSGLYRQMTAANSDIDALLVSGNRQGESESVEDMRAEKWKERGPYLTLLLLPLAALAFRRGWLFSIAVAVLFVSPSHDVMAFEWRDLWQRADQQAAEALQQQEYDRVPEISSDPSLLGSAAYKRGDFQQALEQFDRLDGADAAYNRGNALARLGQYREAIEAYDEALEQQPEMEDAIFNKAAIEELLKQREQEEQEQTDEQQQPQEEGNRAQQSEQQQEQQQASSEQQEQENQQADSGEGSPEQDSQSQQSAQQQGEQGQAQQEGAEEDAQSAQQQADQSTGAGENPDENQFAKANEALDENRNDDGSNEEEFEGESSGEQPRQPETAGEDEMQPGNSEQQQASAEELSSEEEMAAQQWLRRIPDDPGGLLRRKFLYQYRERGRSGSTGGQGY
jgi:Ca-activated chloride channel family protein